MKNSRSRSSALLPPLSEILRFLASISSRGDDPERSPGSTHAIVRGGRDTKDAGVEN